MIDVDTRKAIFLLHEKGMQVRELSRKFHLSRNSIRRIIREKGCSLTINRKDKLALEPDLVRKYFTDCEGWTQRVYEKLKDDGIEVGYSTLTRYIRSLGLGEMANHRHAKVPDEPGLEMQHDTSPYIKLIGQKQMRIIGSCLYFRYSKVRYLKFYPFFNRFRMKCFFHEALFHYGYCAHQCIIDNTNLAVLHGTGKNAVMVTEMASMAEFFGFKFIAHEIKHSNRKAGEERSFWFVETNFFPGRTFESLEDLNQQAFKWATEAIHARPQTELKIIPAKYFEFERSYLNRLPPFAPPPTLYHERAVDQYGYAHFDGNYYWIPGTGRGTVDIIEYADRIKIFQMRRELAEYQLPPFGTKHERFPKDRKLEFTPQKSKTIPNAEQKRLYAIDPQVGEFLETVIKELTPAKRERFICSLFSLSSKISRSLFIKTIERARHYGVSDFNAIERIAVYLMREDHFELPLVNLDEDFKERESYLEGQITDPPDFSKYDKWFDDDGKDT